MDGLEDRRSTINFSSPSRFFPLPTALHLHHFASSLSVSKSNRMERIYTLLPSGEKGILPYYLFVVSNIREGALDARQGSKYADASYRSAPLRLAMPSKTM